MDKTENDGAGEAKENNENQEEEEFDYYDEEDDAELTEEQREKKRKYKQYIELFEGVCDTLQSPEIQGSLGKFFGDHKDLFEKDKEEYNHDYKDVYEKYITMFDQIIYKKLRDQGFEDSLI